MLENLTVCLKLSIDFNKTKSPQKNSIVQDLTSVVYTPHLDELELVVIVVVVSPLVPKWWVRKGETGEPISSYLKLGLSYCWCYRKSISFKTDSKVRYGFKGIQMDGEISKVDTCSGVVVVRVDYWFLDWTTRQQ